MHGCVFEVVLVWSAYLSHTPIAASYPRVSEEQYTGSLELSSSLLLAPSLRPPSNLLLRILLFLLFLWLNASVCRCTGALARLKPELKRTHVEANVPRKLTVTARTIFPPPHKAQIVSEGESQGRHLDTGGGFTRKHDRRGPNNQLPCILDRQRRLPRTLRDHVWFASALSALQKKFGRQPVR